MTDLKNPSLIWAKGILFLLLAMVAAILLLVEAPGLKNAALLALAIWASCRFYYFAFYVIEKYVDPSYRFAGLGSFVLYALRGRAPRQ
jgi:GNAT superfamily N-acetyltransferase